ncbi:transcription factor LBX2 isoform X2 [Oenanthe melanoleuca]|uniref:transcription factor LBX2 isoform X2 n=1 Tax=Oenanthe melanoleuca TaxID=2939378 RepID=UPI0024C131C7|nr:transcription factor LBX2 isoform X2 [Oenanthe melanoleuca]
MWSEPRFGSVSAAAAGLEPTGGRSEKEIGTAIGIPPAAWSRARGGDPRLAGDLYVARGSSDGTGAGSGHGIECGVQPGLGSPEIAEKEGPGSLPRLAASFRAPGAAAGGTRMSQPRSQRGRLRHDRGHCRTMIPGFQRRPRFGLLGSVGHDSLWDGSSAFGSMWADSSPFYRESAGPGAGTHPQCSARLGGAGTGAVTGALALLCPQVGTRSARRPSPPGASGPRPPCRKRRKSRTAFTAQQLRELEQRFRRQRYLSPVDRDALAARLALSAAQVITWFQNRRAKLKRDLEELRADVASLQALPPAALQQLAGLPEPPGSPGTGTGTTEPAELSEEEIDVAD